jgi:PTH1 family peptidyl-tRNA hydrolase
MNIAIGLGNPGEEYLNTRHNAGRMALQHFIKKRGFESFEEDEKLRALKTKANIGGEKFLLLTPETYMNKSGETIKALLKSSLLKPSKDKTFSTLLILHDDLALPLGKFKISVGKNSAGHKGVESIIKALKNKNFARIRIGISPKKKPKGKRIVGFILGRFSPKELKILNSVFKKISETIETIAKEGV